MKLLWVAPALLAMIWLAGCAGVTPPEPKPPAAGSALALPSGEPLTPAQLQQRIDQAQVVLVAEVHNHPGHHAIQLDFLKRMLAAGKSLVVGVEWLDSSNQAVCDELSQGQISVDEFAKKVDWPKKWGFPFKMYKPIFQLIAAKHIPLLALNAPLPVVRQVAKGGLKSLTPAQRAQLAPALDLGDEAYRKRVARQFAGHGVKGSQRQDNFFAAQVARDETMANNLARSLEP